MKELSSDQNSKSLTRLMQNRQSAKKCRIKKKEEFVQVNFEVKRLAAENNELKKNVSHPYFSDN